MPSAGVGRSNASTCCRLKPVFAVCNATSVASNVPAPASSTNENAIWTVANTRNRRLVPGVMRMLPLVSPSPADACEDGRRGMYASSTAAAIAAFLLFLRNETGKLPHVYFGWSEGNPLSYLMKYIAFGEGDTAPVAREVLRQAEPEPQRRPRIHLG